jgi:hypothetical protein
MKIAILMEGETERVFLPCLREFLSPRLIGKMPRLIANKVRRQNPQAGAFLNTILTLCHGDHI